MKNSGSQERFRIAVVQPRCYSASFGGGGTVDGSREAENLQVAASYVARAAEQGADLAIFPELFPGPTAESDSLTFTSVIEETGQQARAAGLAVAFGGADRRDTGYYNTYNLVTPGGQLFTYAKMIPATGETTAIPGESPVVVDLGKAKIGLAICWEAWFPEIARALAFGGAELILFPTGGLIYELHDTWKALLQARAAENIAYVAASVRMFGAEDGMGYILGPEGVEASLLREGMITADLDLSHLREMRSVDQVFSFPFPYRTIPGLLRSLRPGVVAGCHKAGMAYPFIRE